jgi:hypothetical protein
LLDLVIPVVIKDQPSTSGPKDGCLCTRSGCHHRTLSLPPPVLVQVRASAASCWYYITIAVLFAVLLVLIVIGFGVPKIP